MVEQEDRDLAKGALINAIGMLVKSSKAIYLVVLPRLFGAELFGLNVLVLAIHEAISKVTGLGLEWAALRLIVQMKALKADDRIDAAIYLLARKAALASTLFAAALATVSWWVAAHVFLKPDLGAPLALSCAALPFLNIQNILLYGLRASRRMQFEMIVKSLFEPLVLLGAGLFAYVFYRNILGILGAYVFSIALATGLALIYFRKVFPNRSAALPMEIDWKDVFRYSVPMSGMDLLNTLKLKLDLMAIGRFLSLASSGIFGAVVELANLIRKIRLAFEPIFMPIIAHFHETGEKERLQRQFVMTVRWTILSSMMLLGPMTVAPELFLRVFGSKFETGSTALVILAWGMFVYATIGLADAVLSMTGHAVANLLNAAGLIALNFVLLVLLVPNFGLTGAALATTISFVVISVVRILQTFRYAGVHPLAKSHLKSLGAAVLAIAAGRIFRGSIGPESFGVLLSAQLIFYFLFAALVLAFGLEPEDREMAGKIYRFIRKEPNRR